MRVLAAMSGGVDSAVAAARAADAGHDVTGIHLALSRNPQSYRTGARGCCTIEDSNDARRAADVIGIPFYVWDMSDRFHEDVVEDFMAEYSAGRTPNPCLRCNEKIKFAAVLDRAIALGFDAVATGHYARLVTGDDGLVAMHRAVDPGKDQSYVLGVLTQEQLAHSLFPLGDSPKSEVRAEAERRGLQVAHKPDSHDICFISDGDTTGWLRDRLGSGSGDIVDHATGEVLGSHEGAFGFTIGQRKGLRIGTPTDDGRPRYVLDIEPVSGTVTVGPREQLTVDRVEGSRPRWCGSVPHEPLRGTVQLRAHGGEHRAVVTVRADASVLVELLDPAQGIAPGQAAVVYDGTRVVGSCTISSASRTAALGMTAATGVGSMPGDDAEDYELAVRVVLEELTDLPHVPELPGRGAHADMIGRTLAVVAELGADLQPAGWRLTDASGIDHRRAKSLLAQDLDAVEELTQGYSGPFKIQVAGPWTLAAMVERPRGDRVLADHGARRELAEALAEGLRDHVADVRRRIPDADLVVQVDEPALPAVLAGAVPTASGFHRHRSVDPPRASPPLEWVLRGGDRVRCHPGRALLRGRRAPRAAHRSRRGRASPWTSTCSRSRRTTSWRRCSSRGGRCTWASCPPARRRARCPTPRSRSGCSGCWTCSAWTRRPRRRWWSPPAAAWPAPTRPGPAVRCTSAARSPPRSPDPAVETPPGRRRPGGRAWRCRPSRRR